MQARRSRDHELASRATQKECLPDANGAKSPVRGQRAGIKTGDTRARPPRAEQMHHGVGLAPQHGEYDATALIRAHPDVKIPPARVQVRQYECATHFVLHVSVGAEPKVAQQFTISLGSDAGCALLKPGRDYLGWPRRLRQQCVTAINN
jgi:hypothetical protein